MINNNIILPVPYRQGPYGQGDSSPYKYITGELGGGDYDKYLNHLQEFTELLEPVSINHYPDDKPSLGHFARSFMALQKTIVKRLVKNYNPDFKLAVIGGDHSVSAAVGPALSNLFSLEKTLLIWVDAHGDINTPETSISNSITGFPLALHYGLGPEQLLHPYHNHINKCVMLGIRDLDQKEYENLKQTDTEVYSILEVYRQGVVKIAERILCISKDYERVWVSIDLDVLDPVYFEKDETDVPSPFGLNPTDLLVLIDILSESKKFKILELHQLNNLNKKTNLTFAASRLLERFFGIANFRYAKKS